MSELPRDGSTGCVAQLVLLMGMLLVVGAWVDECQQNDGRWPTRSEEWQ